MLTIIWMICNQGCTVQKTKIALLCAYYCMVFLSLYVDCSVKKLNFIGLGKLNKILALLSQTP